MSKKAMLGLFEQLSYRHPTWQVYTDFLELSAVAISNVVDYRKYKEREERYKSVMQEYSEKERLMFSQLFAELVDALEAPRDYLGELFMELDFGNKWKGQVFTPCHLCTLTAEIAAENIDEIIDKNGFIELNEPAVGGGAMVIAFVDAMKNKGYNPQQQLKAVCQDLDLKAVYMSYIQLSLLGIPAQICHADTISMEVFDVFRTPMWVFHGWEYRERKSQKQFEMQEDGQLSIVV